MRAPGIICVRPAISLSPASHKAVRGIGGRHSRMNHIRGREAQASADPLAPVPAATGDAEIVPPHHLSGSRCLLGWQPFFEGVKAFAAIGNHQTRRSHIGRQILPAHGNGILDADDVVEIDHGIDGGQDAIAQHPLAQCLGRAGRAGRLGAKPLEHLIPGGQMFKGPGASSVPRAAHARARARSPPECQSRGGFHHDAEGTKPGANLAISGSIRGSSGTFSTPGQGSSRRGGGTGTGVPLFPSPPTVDAMMKGTGS